jgi:ubiquinone/menaquinone biosynthesis C-methylase UbiE|tara:strand:- start:364 stop:1083 length:720 start_codon:yes stop_codon:yes gene_type:complete
MKSEVIKDIWQKKHSFKKPCKIKDNDITLKYLLKYIPRDKDVNVLDAGCGDGRYAYKLASLGYKNIFAVDLFERIQTDKYVYKQSSIDSLPYRDNFFDFVYSSSVIYYLKDTDRGFMEIKRVLKKDSIVLLTSHTRYSLFTLYYQLLTCRGLKPHLKTVKYHNSLEYKKMLEKNGFEILLLDGFKLSFFLYPAYKRVVDKIYNLTGFKLPEFEDKITSNKVLALLKSIFAYHLIITARK